MTHPMPRARSTRRRIGWLCLLALSSAGCDGGTAPELPEADGTLEGAPYSHDRAPGASARDLLSAADYATLVVQVQYVEGHAPSASGLEQLERFLADRLHKPGGISLEVDAPLAVSPRSTYSAAEIRSLEDAHRTAYTHGDTLAVYLVFLPGSFAESANVLGLAYNNTSMAVFGEVIADNTGGPLQPSESTVTATVTMHEFGHIMGLVGNGSPMQLAHQDEPNGHHCDDPDCLMYYAVRTTDFLANLLGGAPSLDQDCLDDLAANGGK